MNKLLAINSVKRSSSNEKKDSVYTVSDKQLRKDIYLWDPAVRQFIRVKK